jgi:hypothetical protein
MRLDETDIKTQTAYFLVNKTDYRTFEMKMVLPIVQFELALVSPAVAVAAHVHRAELAAHPPSSCRPPSIPAQ